MTIYERVAKAHNVSPQEAEAEIRAALLAAGLDVNPEDFVRVIASAVIVPEAAPRAAAAGGIGALDPS